MKTLADTLRTLAESATEGPWEMDSVRNPDGEYGSGPDPDRGYDDYEILGADGLKILGTEDAAHKEIEVEQDDEGYLDACLEARARFALLPAHPVEPQDVQAGGVEAVQRVALAMVRDLKRTCISFDGTCYAAGDEQLCPDGWVAEVDGEIDMLSLAEAAIAAMPTPTPVPAFGDGALRKALERLAKLTPSAANASDAHDLHLTVKAIAETALSTSDQSQEVEHG